MIYKISKAFMIILYLSTSVFLGGCILEKPKPVYNGQVNKRFLDYSSIPQTQNDIGRSTNSLWSKNQVGFFQRNRAQRVGDILTLVVEIKDKADVTNGYKSDTHNSTEGSMEHFFGITKLIPNFKLEPKLSLKRKFQNKIDSNTKGEDKINLQVAAIITRVMPNGNLIVEADQQVIVGNETRSLKIVGIVRPQDIDSQNRINHTKLAQARIFYGDFDPTIPYGQELYSKIAPF